MKIAVAIVISAAITIVDLEVVATAARNTALQRRGCAFMVLSSQLGSTCRRVSKQPTSSCLASSEPTHQSEDYGRLKWCSDIGKTLATTALVTASLWAAPAFLASNAQGSFLHTSTAASAKEMASGSGSRVNKDPESLLRYGLPISNKEVRKLQVALEEIKLDMGSKRTAAALEAVRNSKVLLQGKQADAMISSCRDASLCQSLITQIRNELDPLANELEQSQSYFRGSEQERDAYDRAYTSQDKTIGLLTTLEEQMVPANYRVSVPNEYRQLPQLMGRATVEMDIVKADKGTFDIMGQIFPKAKLVMVLDGYTSPITAGNFVDLVQRGFYNNMPIQRSDGFVVQTGDPDGDAIGYVGRGSSAVGNGPKGERLIPLEIFIRGDKAPLYERTIEDDGRGGQATILPFSAYGAMGWARDEYDPNSGSSQFFWLLFESDLTPAGKNVLDGRYPCFGYVVQGADFLTDIDEGDVIISAKVTQGAQNLIPGQD